jgi:hypothetical protein
MDDYLITIETETGKRYIRIKDDSLITAGMIAEKQLKNGEQILQVERIITA